MQLVHEIDRAAGTEGFHRHAGLGVQGDEIENRS